MRFGVGMAACLKGASAATFDPATLSLSGWWRASYAGAPWSGTASAGTSGANNLALLGAAPTAGPAVSTYTPADFDGTTQALSGAALSTFLTDTAYTVLVAFYSDVASALTDGVGYLFGDDGGYMSLGFTTSGVSALGFDGASKTAAIACAHGAWHLAMAKLSGGNLYAGVDGTWSAPTACGAIGSLAGTSRVGIAYSGDRLDGRLLEVVAAPSVLSDGTISQYRSYLQARYPAAGFP